MDNLVIRVVDALCEDIGTPRANLVKDLVHRGEWTQLQELRVVPSDYSDSESYFKDAVITDLLRKCDLRTSVDKEKAAVQTFWNCELQNCTTNARLNRYTEENLLIETPSQEAVYSFILDWRKDIDNVIGNLPNALTPRFSAGATFADTGKLITIPDKMSSVPTIYEGSRCLLPLWNETSWARSLTETRPTSCDPLSVRGNIFFTVPKDGKTYRGCCKEASIPVSYQLDVGRILKTRLLRIGIDLKEGQFVHRSLARAASIDGSLATIDMSNASDTVCRVLPKLVLKPLWWELLNSLRATHTRVSGKWVRLEKFSSMGNGFTFELESLLFATLARTVVGKEGGDPSLVRCYGDDLIVPSAYSKSVLTALRFFGFTPNERKTFVEGPFRESCGGDYWLGTPVRAHFIQELPNEPQQWISLANGLRRLASIDGCLSHRWDYIRRSWLRALYAVPSDIRRCRGPSFLGDVVIHDDPERWQHVDPPRSLKKGITVSINGVQKTLVEPYGDSFDQKWIRAYLPLPNVLPWDHWKPAVQLASCTLGLPSAGVTPRGDISGYRISRVPVGITASWLPSIK